MPPTIEKIVDTVQADLKQLYKQNPMQMWDLPIIVICKVGGEVQYLDNVRSDEQAVEWLAQHLDKNLETIVVGRMVVKRGGVLDAMGEPTIKEKGLMVMARNMIINRTRVSIVKCNEHREYRTAEVVEKQGSLINPAVSSPDVTKSIVDDTGLIAGVMTGQFGKEDILDSKDGQEFLSDPIIAGLVEYQKTRIAQDIIDANLAGKVQTKPMGGLI